LIRDQVWINVDGYDPMRQKLSQRCWTVGNPASDVPFSTEPSKFLSIHYSWRSIVRQVSIGYKWSRSTWCRGYLSTEQCGPKNDVILFYRKRFCASGLGLELAEIRLNTFSVKRLFGQV